MPADYQQLKQAVLDHLPLAKDAIHIYIGFGCLLISVLVLRIPASAWRALLLGLVVSIVMEVLDLRNNAGYPERMRWIGSLRDLVNTNLIPVAVVLLARRKRPGGTGRQNR